MLRAVTAHTGASGASTRPSAPVHQLINHQRQPHRPHATGRNRTGCDPVQVESHSSEDCGPWGRILFQAHTLVPGWLREAGGCTLSCAVMRVRNGSQQGRGREKVWRHSKKTGLLRGNHSPASRSSSSEIPGTCPPSSPASRQLLLRLPQPRPGQHTRREGSPGQTLPGKLSRTQRLEKLPTEQGLLS